jgi:catechol 2,3-dioxygenase-like lactoylglutathione lyase family enzyme
MLHLDTVLLFVQDPDKLKDFYTRFFQLELVEEIPGEWILLKAGLVYIGLHKIGDAYLESAANRVNTESNFKLIFDVNEDLDSLRKQLLNQEVAMRDLKTFPNYPYLLCDGEDPEGNVFQLRQKIG